MAKQIEFNQTALHPKEALSRKLEQAPLEHAEALLKGYEVLQAAQENGVLDLLQGAITAQDKIVEKVAGYANTPEGINTMRNLLVVGSIVGSVDPDFMHQATKELTAGIDRDTRRRRPGLWGTLRRLTSPDVLIGLSLAITVLEVVGRTVRTQSKNQFEGRS